MPLPQSIDNVLKALQRDNQTPFKPGTLCAIGTDVMNKLYLVPDDTDYDIIYNRLISFIKDLRRSNFHQWIQYSKDPKVIKGFKALKNADAFNNAMSKLCKDTCS
jgi:hypothetical protein